METVVVLSFFSGSMVDVCITIYYGSFSVFFRKLTFFVKKIQKIVVFSGFVIVWNRYWFVHIILCQKFYKTTKFKDQFELTDEKCELAGMNMGMISSEDMVLGKYGILFITTNRFWENKCLNRVWRTAILIQFYNKCIL